jgi:hypothetical protein
MKNLFLCLALFMLWSCKTTAPVSRWDLIFKGPISSNQNPALVSNENRVTKDSLDFIVIKGKYISGSRHVEILWDKNAKLYYWKQYHPNGKLKEKGILTKENRFCVGKWEYYNENGTIDSIVDFDKKSKISYFKAIKIASEYGYTLPEAEVDIEKIEGRNYWQIRKWNMRNGDGNSITLLIDMESGGIRKDEHEETRHY